MREIRTHRSMWRELETESRTGLRHRQVAKAAGQQLLPRPEDHRSHQPRMARVDRMLERAVKVTQDSYTNVAYARFADDLVVLVDGHPRHAWLMRAVVQRLREELARLQVEVNEDKTKMVDLTRSGSFGFLGFEFCRVRSLRGKWRAQFTPRLVKRTALLRT